MGAATQEHGQPCSWEKDTPGKTQSSGEVKTVSQRYVTVLQRLGSGTARVQDISMRVANCPHAGHTTLRHLGSRCPFSLLAPLSSSTHAPAWLSRVQPETHQDAGERAGKGWPCQKDSHQGGRRERHLSLSSVLNQVKGGKEQLGS